jgi:hypothetical protein
MIPSRKAAAPEPESSILEHLELWALPARPPPTPLVQGKIDALIESANGKRLSSPDHGDGIFIDDVPAYAQ